MMPSGLRSNSLLTAVEIAESGTFPVPNVSMRIATGFTTPIAYEICTSHREASPDGDDVLGDVSRAIGSRAVHLCRVLAREAAASVARVAAVGVDHDLASGQAGVRDGAADDEAAGRD